VPIALCGVFDLLPIHTRHLYPVKLTVRVGEPINTTGMTPHQIDELTAQLRDAIEALKQQEKRDAGRSTTEAAAHA
jgi:1-acyl-sn-glycerol-3-phosphate acyltransferase